MPQKEHKALKDELGQGLLSLFTDQTPKGWGLLRALQPVLEVYRPKFDVCIQFYRLQMNFLSVILDADLKFWSVNLQNWL